MGIRRLHDALQAFQVHLIEAIACALEGVVHHHAVVACDEHSEGMINRLLNNDFIARTSEMVQCQPKSVDNAANETSLILREFQAVALSAVPISRTRLNA